MTNFLKQRELEREKILKEIADNFDILNKTEIKEAEKEGFLLSQKRSVHNEILKATLNQHDKDTEQFKDWVERLKEELHNKDWKEITNEHAIDLFDTIDNLSIKQEGEGK